MSKKGSEWVYTFEENVAVKIMKNINKHYKNPLVVLDKEFDKPYTFLSSAFSWEFSPEGYKYWDNISMELMRKDPDLFPQNTKTETLFDFDYD